MNEEGQDGGLRAPRRLRRRDPGGPRGARLPAVRRRRPSLQDRHRGAGIPDGLDWKAFNGELKRRGLVLAGGQGKLTGKVFRRRSPRARSTVDDIVDALETLEAVSIDMGPPRSRPGVAAAAAAARPRRRPRSSRLDAQRPPPSRRSTARTLRILVAETHRAGGHRGACARTTTSTSGRASPREELRAIVGDYDALIVRSQVAVDAALIAAGPRLQVIGRAGVGVDNVDLDAATRAGITVVNAPTGNTIAAAEHTIALLLALARRVARGRCLDPARRMEARARSRASSCAAGRWASSGSARSAWPSRSGRAASG